MKPISDATPCPAIDLRSLDNPVPAIMAAPEFEVARQYFFASSWQHRSLVGARGHALAHTLIRHMRPKLVVEIGTYRAGMTETMIRALVVNGDGGVVHTVGPFDSDAYHAAYNDWSPEFRQAVRFYPADSMSFFMEMERQKLQLELVFVDGNHDYEFALFDIFSAARRLAPGGFVIVDDASQVGPYFAAQDFMARNPDWINCTWPSTPVRDRARAFDRERSGIRGTNLIVLRAPRHRALVDDRPQTFGEIAWAKPEASAVTLALDGRHGGGSLHVDCILRGFGGGHRPSQIVTRGSMTIQPGQTEARIDFGEPAKITVDHDRYALEIWLIWIGEGPLTLLGAPDAS